MLNAVRAIEAGHATHVLCLAGGAQDSAFFKERIARFTGAMADYLTPHGCGRHERALRHHPAQAHGALRDAARGAGADRRRPARQRLPQRPGAAPRADHHRGVPRGADRGRSAPALRLRDAVLRGGSGARRPPRPRPEGQGRAHPGRIRAAQPSRGRGRAAPRRLGAVPRRALFNDAGVGPKDMDFVQAYDDYPIMVAIQLEDHGFCEKGGVGAFLAEHTHDLGGIAAAEHRRRATLLRSERRRAAD